MTVMVALLRGVNVGGRGKLPMADLRAVATACGYGGVRTYIQSGNLVLTADDPAPATGDVARTLRRAIAAATDVDPAVIVRTAAELVAVAAANPFLRRGEDPDKLHVVFLEGPAEGALDDVDLPAFAPEEAVATGREVYLFLPDGMGRSKLAVEIGRKGRPAKEGTARNWRTVTRLLAMAGEDAPA
jgi:uncharacterized protein (DUF1697 family)